MLLLVADDDQEIIEILEQNFRKTDFTIEDLMEEAKNYSAVETWGEFLKFGNMVRNLTVTLERLEAIGDFCQNQSLMKILVRKLEPFQMERWGEYKVTRNIKSASLCVFNDWIKHQSRIANELYYTPYEREQCNATQSLEPVNTNEIMPKLPEAEKKLTKTFNSNVCVICKKSSHNADGCSEFIAADVKKRWQMAEKFKLCFCLDRPRWGSSTFMYYEMDRKCNAI
jgi:hypothetical protein